jgi:hypothetical protein
MIAQMTLRSSGRSWSGLAEQQGAGEQRGGRH